MKRPSDRPEEQNQNYARPLQLAHRRQSSTGESVHRFYQLERIGKFPVKFFAARKELEFIAEYLYCPTNDPTCSTIITLTGLGGPGKTQLILQYASKQRESYGVVLWFDARSMETLRESFEYAACQLCGIALPSFHQSSISASKEMSLHQPSIDINFYKIWKELRSRGQRWLLLFDEVDDILMINALPRYLFSDPEGHILISSRRKEAYRIGTYAVEVSGLSVESAQQLLLHHARIRSPSALQIAQAEEVVESLECIALATDLTGL